MQARNNKKYVGTRKSHNDQDLENNKKMAQKLKNSTSHKRNQASKRLIEQIKGHHRATGFKTLVNFLHTWERGHDYTWTSENWGQTKPVVGTGVGEDIPLIHSQPRRREQSHENFSSPELSDHEDSEHLPDSQELGVREKAVAASDSDKKEMRVTCMRCMGGKKKTDKIGSWIRCGYRGCSRLHAHSRCNAISIPNIKTQSALDTFCKETIRCNLHMGKAAEPPKLGCLADFEDSDSDSPDPDFVSPKKVKKSCKKGKRKETEKSKAPIQRTAPWDEASVSGVSETEVVININSSEGFGHTSETEVVINVNSNEGVGHSKLSKSRVKKPSQCKTKKSQTGKEQGSTNTQRGFKTKNKTSSSLPGSSRGPRQGPTSPLPGHSRGSSDDFSDPGMPPSRREKNRIELKKLASQYESSEPIISDDGSDKSWSYV